MRQAISYAIDRESMVSDLLKDTAVPAYDVQPMASSDYTPAVGTVNEYNPEKARELLAEAGYPNGFSTVLETSVDGSGQMIPAPMGEFIQQNLAEVGITVELKTHEWINYIARHNAGLTPEVGLGQLSWGMSTPFWIDIITNSKFIAPAGQNVGYYANAELEAATQAALLATEADAPAAWAQVNQIASTDLPIIPVVTDKSPYVLSERVQGFVLPSEEWYDLTTVHLAE